VLIMSHKHIELGDVLREHSVDSYRDLGVVVWKNIARDMFWWIPFPAVDENGKRDYFIKAPVQWSLSAAEKRLGITEFPKLSILKFRNPDTWSLTDEELEKLRSSAGLTRPSRRNLKKWKKRRDRNWEIIKPIVEENDTFVLVEDDQAPALAAKRAKELGNVGSAFVLRLIRLYLLGAGHRNCLLPGWHNSGKPGSTKYCQTKTGRPNILTTKDDKSNAGHVCTAADRKRLADGYEKYKKRGKFSVHSAYLLTMEEYYAQSVAWISTTKKDVILRPKKERPTESEFGKHGPGKKPENAAHRLNLGVNFHERNGRGLTGTSRDGILALGQNSWIDSTSEDQTPVSSASRLKVLPSTWRTMVMEGYTEYILGIHCGFERPSVMTGLLALLHAASPKQEECKLIGVPEDEWKSFMPKRVRGDNGDVKTERGIATLERGQITLEIARSYGSELKGPEEAGHKIIHRSADHGNLGSTKGKQRARGEPKREAEACRTHFENQPNLFRAIHRHNNVDPVPHLLNLEMRNDGVEPTRKAIFEWCINNGYMVSEPIDLADLRAQCLPRLKAVIKGNGIHVYDPRDPERRLIPGMVYWSRWLHESGLTEKARRKDIETEIHMNPSRTAEAWIYLDGSHRLDLRTADPLRGEVTLCDWLLITDDDKLRAFLGADAIESYDVSRLASNDAQNKVAVKAKKQEAEAQPRKPTKSDLARDKRENVKEELENQRRVRLGIEHLSAVPSPRTCKDKELKPPADLSDDELQDLMMAQGRRRRAA
jgi:hypothetical protein